MKGSLLFGFSLSLILTGCLEQKSADVELLDTQKIAYSLDTTNDDNTLDISFDNIRDLYPFAKQKYDRWIVDTAHIDTEIYEVSFDDNVHFEIDSIIYFSNDNLRYALVAVVSYLYVGEDYRTSCHACAPVIDFFLFNLSTEDWVLESGPGYHLNHGSYGEIGDYALFQLGDITTLSLKSFYATQGHNDGRESIHSLSKSSFFNELISYDYLKDNTGADGFEEGISHETELFLGKEKPYPSISLITKSINSRIVRNQKWYFDYKTQKYDLDVERVFN